MISSITELLKSDEFKQYGPAIIALLGVCVGAFVAGALAFLNAWIMRNRDLKLKLWERFLDRRIAAHEGVVNIAVAMRNMVPLGGIESNGELSRSPQVMLSKEAFDAWLLAFAEIAGPASTWLSTPVKREVNFVQDYLVTLHTNLSTAPPDCFAKVGAFIRQDFIDLSARLERLAFEYFKTEAASLRLNDLSDHHKYQRKETDARLHKTVLLGKWTEVEAILRLSGEPPA